MIICHHQWPTLTHKGSSNSYNLKNSATRTTSLLQLLQYGPHNSHKIQFEAFSRTAILRARSGTHKSHTTSHCHESYHFRRTATFHTTCAREQEGALLRTPKRSETP